MKEKIVFIALIALLFSPAGITAEKNSNDRTLVISAGAKLTTHQPKVIIPILTEVLRRLDYSIKPVHYPSPRSLLYSNSGVVDGEMHRIYHFHDVSKGKYPNLYRINSPVMSVYIAAFAAKPTINITTYSDLKSYSVAFKRGRKNLESILPKHVLTHKLHPVASDQEAFHMLSQNKIDIVISEKVKGDKIISENKELSAVQLVRLLDEIEIYTYLHIKHRELADRMSLTLDKMKKDGSFRSISEQANTLFTSSPK